MDGNQKLVVICVVSPTKGSEAPISRVLLLGASLRMIVHI